MQQEDNIREQGRNGKAKRGPENGGHLGNRTKEKMWNRGLEAKSVKVRVLGAEGSGEKTSEQDIHSQERLDESGSFGKESVLMVGGTLMRSRVRKALHCLKTREKERTHAWLRKERQESSALD